MDTNTSDDVERLLTDADIQEFIDIYKKTYKEELGPRDARELATGLLQLYTALAKPLPSELRAAYERAKPKDSRVQSSLAPLTRVIDILPKKKPEM